MGRRWGWFFLGGALSLVLVLACGDAPPPYFFDTSAGGFPGTSGGSSGVSSSGGTTGGSTSGLGPLYCEERPFCGSVGCCPPGWRCIDRGCVPPGVTCTSDADCTSHRYCAVGLLEPRCFPRPVYCDDEVGLECVKADCMGLDFAMTNGRAQCSQIDIFVRNLGRETIPRGVTILFEHVAASIPGKDAGPDADGQAGDAGDAVDTSIVARVVTTDGVLPGETIKVTVSANVEPSRSIRASMVRDGVLASDCEPANDSLQIYNGCPAHTGQ